MVREFAPGIEVPPKPPPPPPTFLQRHTVTIGLALLGGVFAVLGAFIEEMRGGGGIFLAVVLAPVIEEVLKPIGVIWVLEKRPHYLLSRVHVVVLCVVGALVFATLENLLYIHVHWPLQQATAEQVEISGRGPGPEPGAAETAQRASFIRFRFTACTALHVLASAIVGLGLGRQLIRMRREKSDFDLERSLSFLIAAIVLHGTYNATVFILERAGWRPWS